MWFCAPSLCAPPPFLSSLAHIWFLSLDLCVFGVKWSSLGLPAHTQTEVAYGLLDLFTQWDWSTYLADYGRPTCKYLRVNPHTALTLLEKMKETSKKNVVLAQFKKADRDRQKLIDTVIKQLRNLIAQHHA
ncbi:Exocyst complex component 6B [Crenichthys baileyi]|uniref:Exocyst complex component 6B n=1 Tax=Crenichthys baileyi TaxID=28760 RepID=A0AAV9S411_9TELE